MTTQRQQDRGQRPPPIRASNRIFELVDRQTGRVIAQTSDRAAALRLRRQDPSLMFRGRDITGPPGIGIPRAEDVMRSRRAQAEFEAGQERSEAEQRQFEADMDAVRPFQDAEGRIDVVAALEGGVSQDVLNRLITPEGVARGETVRRALAEVAPFRDSEGRIDLVAALEGGVPQETLNLLFEQASAQLETARVAVGARTRLRDEGVLDIEGGADLLVIIERGLESTALEAGFTDDQIAAARQVVDARKELRQAGLLDENNNADLVEIIGRGMESTALRAGFSEDDLGSARQVVASRTTLREAGVLDENNRADLVGVISQGLEDAARQAGFTDEDLGQARGVHEARETLREAGILDDEGNARLDFVFERGLENVALAAGFTPEQLATARAGFQARRSEVARIQDAVPQLPAHRRADIVSWANRVEGALVAAATSSRPASDIPVDEQVALAQRRIADTVQDQATFISTFRALFQNDIDNAQQTIRVAQRRMARNPDNPGHRELLARGQAALADAQAAMSVFQREIEPLMRQELQAGAARALNVFRTAAGILVEAGPGIPPPSVAPAEGVDVTTRARVVNPETGETVATVQGAEAIAAAEAAGFTVKPFMPEPEIAPVAPAGPRGIGPFEPEPEVAGVATPEQVLALEQLRARQMDARLRPPPGIGPVAESERLSAEQQLVEAGVIDSQGGIFVLDALEAGIPEGTLLAAGLTQEQINTAKVAPTLAATPGEIPTGPLAPGLPTAEPRLKPAPGETLPVAPEITDRLSALRQEQVTFLEQSGGFAGLAPEGATIPASSITPEFQALERQIALIRDIQTAVEIGDLTNAQAVDLLQDIPQDTTDADIRQARRNLGTQVQIAGGMPLIGLPLSAAGTALTFAEDSPFERGLNIGLDVLSLVPLIAVAARGARIAGSARGAARAGFITRELAAAEMTPFFLNPKQALRGAITDPIEAMIRPSRIIGPEESFTTLRLAASGEQGHRIKSALSDSVIELMQTGKTSTRAVEGIPATVTSRAGSLHRTIGANAIHATPDGRNILAGPTAIQGIEGGLFVAPTPLTRFAEATAFGRSIPLNETAQAAVAAGRLPSEPVPTILIIRNPDLLARLQPAVDAAGKPKLFNNLAEAEAIIPNGNVLPRPSQTLLLRGQSGQRIAVAVIGDPLTVAQQARLKIGGLTQQVRNIFEPGVIMDFGGDDAIAASLKSGFLNATVEDILTEARRLRAAGRIEEALQLENAARRVSGRAQELSSGSIARLFPGRVESDVRDVIRPDADVVPRRGIGLEAPTVDTRRLVVPGVDDRVDARTIIDSGEDTRIPGRVGRDFDRLDTLATETQRRPLTESEQNESRDIIARLEAQPLPERQQQDVQRAADTIRATIEGEPEIPRAEGPRIPATGEPTRLPEAPSTPSGIPRAPSVPRVPSVPAVPGVPRVPEIPRVPGVPAVPRPPTAEPPRIPGVPRIPGAPVIPPVPPSAPPGFPLPGTAEEPPTEEEGRVPIPRIVGVHHGNWERIYDLLTGQVTLVDDDPRIPNVPSRQSFTVLATGFRPVSVREFPMGKAFVAVSPQGVSFRGRKPKKAGGRKSRKEALNNDDLPRIVEFQAGDFHITKDLQSGEEIVSPRRGPDGVLATNREFQGPSRRALGPRGSEFRPRKSGA